MGGYRHVAARQLVFALRTGFHSFQTLGQREIDRLMVADLEMQKRMILDAAPVPAVKRVRADKVDRTGNIAPLAFRHDQQHVIGHSLADQRIKFPGQIGPAPFTAAGIHVEGEKLVPDVLRQVGTRQPVDLDAVFQR